MNVVRHYNVVVYKHLLFVTIVLKDVGEEARHTI